MNINDKEVEAKEGMTILQAARDVGIDIPTLCYDHRLSPYGACRLCMVEISINGKTSLVSSCLYYVEDGLHVNTESPRVIKIRKILLELIMASVPLGSAPGVEDLARRYGVEEPRFEAEASPCIRCGQCVRYCSEIKKAHALGFISRGVNRQVAFVPGVDSTGVCTGCRECYGLCPVRMWG